MVERTKLPRAAWDFSRCPPEHLWRCHSYEYARHIPAIIAKYEAAKASRIGFDECCNWNYVRQDDDGENVVGFCIPAGFPDVPFLEALPTASFPDYPRFRVPSIRAVRDGDRLAKSEQAHTVAIKWHYPDEAILRDFANVLKKIRPSPPFNRRGRSERRRYEAELKALGAYRLLEKGMTSTSAIAYTVRWRGRAFTGMKQSGSRRKGELQQSSGRSRSLSALP